MTYLKKCPLSSRLQSLPWWKSVTCEALWSSLLGQHKLCCETTQLTLRINIGYIEVQSGLSFPVKEVTFWWKSPFARLNWQRRREVKFAELAEICYPKRRVCIARWCASVRYTNAPIALGKKTEGWGDATRQWQNLLRASSVKSAQACYALTFGSRSAWVLLPQKGAFKSSGIGGGKHCFCSSKAVLSLVKSSAFERAIPLRLKSACFGVWIEARLSCNRGAFDHQSRLDCEGKTGAFEKGG